MYRLKHCRRRKEGEGIAPNHAFQNLLQVKTPKNLDQNPRLLLSGCTTARPSSILAAGLPVFMPRPALRVDWYGLAFSSVKVGLLLNWVLEPRAVLCLDGEEISAAMGGVLAVRSRSP